MSGRMTAQEFQEKLAEARSLARISPVFIITDEGRNDQVLMSYEEYRRLLGKSRSIAEAIGYSEAAFVDFDLPERAVSGSHRDVEF